MLLNAIPGPPVVDGPTSEQIRSVMAKGWGGNVLLTTDDVHADYELLKARGVERLTEAPEERPRPGSTAVSVIASGNQFRLTQMREGAEA